MDRAVHIWLNIPENDRIFENPKVRREIQNVQMAISTVSMRPKPQMWPKARSTIT